MVLSRRDRVVIDTLLPANADARLPLGAIEAGFPAFHAELQRTATPLIRRGFRAATFAATWIAPLLIRRRPPLGRHPRDVREQALEAMATSRIALLRQLLVLLKIIVAMSYGADPSVRRAVGYAAPRVQLSAIPASPSEEGA